MQLVTCTLTAVVKRLCKSFFLVPKQGLGNEKKRFCRPFRQQNDLQNPSTAKRFEKSFYGKTTLQVVFSRSQAGALERKKEKRS